MLTDEFIVAEARRALGMVRQGRRSIMAAGDELMRAIHEADRIPLIPAMVEDVPADDDEGTVFAEAPR